MRIFYNQNSLILSPEVLEMALKPPKSPKDRILKRFLSEMTQKGEKEYVLPLVTTLFSLYPSEHEKAIEMIGRVHGFNSH